MKSEDFARTTEKGLELLLKVYSTKSEANSTLPFNYDREKLLLKTLDTHISEHASVALIYGASHMKLLETYLFESKFIQTDESSLLVFPSRPSNFWLFSAFNV